MTTCKHLPQISDGLSPNGSRVFFRFTFVEGALPDKPVALAETALRRLGEIPGLVKAIQTGSTKLGAPYLVGGSIYIDVDDSDSLMQMDASLAANLHEAASELEANAGLQPPKPYKQAVSHPSCIAPLKALSQAFEKTGMGATLHVNGEAIELPRCDPAVFTKPADTPLSRRLRVNVIGICKPSDEDQVLVLADQNILRLPMAHYPKSTDELVNQILSHGITTFLGVALPLASGYKAEPGGQLTTQLDAVAR